ncbi:MAG: PEP-CTERM sorting domain-containing protein [Chitinivibrionales bacterium]|nr:PEP-CTERM sorting domain-containing protein [Chitinivibrionales bacterium]
MPFAVTYLNLPYIVYGRHCVMGFLKCFTLVAILTATWLNADHISFEETFSRVLPAGEEVNSVLTELLQVPSFSMENAVLNSVSVSFDLEWEVSTFNSTAGHGIGGPYPQTFPFFMNASLLNTANPSQPEMASTLVFNSATVTLLEWNFEGDFGYSVTLDNATTDPVPFTTYRDNMTTPIGTADFNATTADFITSDGSDFTFLSLLQTDAGPLSAPCKLNVGYTGRLGVSYDYDITTTPPATVPEPGTVMLLLTGCIAVAVLRKRGVRGCER